MTLSASKLCLHTHRGGADVDAIIRSASWSAIKAFQDSSPLRTAASQGIPIRILRIYNIENMASTDAVNLIMNQDLGAVTHFQLVNESSKGYDLQWQQAVIDGMRQRGYTAGFLGFGFPTGNPTTVEHLDHEHFPDWLTLAPLFPHLDGIILNEYAGTIPSDTARWNEWLLYTAERHQLVHKCLQYHGIEHPPFFIGESGLDNVIPKYPQVGGWLNVGISPTDYMSLLTTLDKIDQADDTIKCRSIFTLFGEPNWTGFEISSILPQLTSYVNSQTGTPVPSPVPPTPPVLSPAEQYYFQLGHTVDTTHAIWTAYLLPAYTLWQSFLQNHDPMADVVVLGPLISGEIGTTWGKSQPASIVKTTNCTGGVYLGTDGTWNHPYRVEVNLPQ